MAKNKLSRIHARATPYATPRRSLHNEAGAFIGRQVRQVNSTPAPTPAPHPACSLSDSTGLNDPREICNEYISTENGLKIYRAFEASTFFDNQHSGMQAASCARIACKNNRDIQKTYRNQTVINGVSYIITNDTRCFVARPPHNITYNEFSLGSTSYNYDGLASTRPLVLPGDIYPGDVVDIDIERCALGKTNPQVAWQIQQEVRLRNASITPSTSLRQVSTNVATSRTATQSPSVSISPSKTTQWQAITSTNIERSTSVNQQLTTRVLPSPSIASSRFNAITSTLDKSVSTPGATSSAYARVSTLENCASSSMTPSSAPGSSSHQESASSFIAPSTSSFAVIGAATTSLLSTVGAFITPVPTAVIAASAQNLAISGVAMAAGVIGSAVVAGGAIYAGYKLVQYCKPEVRVSPSPDPAPAPSRPRAWEGNNAAQHIYDEVRDYGYVEPYDPPYDLVPAENVYEGSYKNQKIIDLPRHQRRTFFQQTDV